MRIQMAAMEVPPEKTVESLKLVGEFVVIMVVILAYGTYLATTHPESWIWLVFLFIAVMLTAVIFTQQYMSIIFERNLIEKIEKIDVDTLARIEASIREKLLTGKDQKNGLKELERQLDKAEENSKFSKPKK
jgi:hypothetical protein